MSDWKFDPDTLQGRLRLLADELDSADRVGVSLPTRINIDQHGAYFIATDAEQFAAWADYVEPIGATDTIIRTALDRVPLNIYRAVQVTA